MTGWASALADPAVLIAVAVVVLGIAVCVTVVLLVAKTAEKDRLQAIKLLVPVLERLASGKLLRRARREEPKK